MKKYKNIVWLFIMLCLAVQTTAQNKEHEYLLSIDYGGVWQQDQYLSPLIYDGMRVGLNNQWTQNFNDTTLLGWKHIGKAHLWGAWMQNQPLTNKMYMLGIQTGWGAYYQWFLAKKKVSIYIGPYLQLDAAGRYIWSEINKPYNMDLGLETQLLAGIGYTFSGKNSSYRLIYEIKANVIGVDATPDYWQSYYEMSEKVMPKVRCSGMWNRRYMEQQLSLDMQFKHSTWRLGIRHEYLEYGQEDMWFSREQVGGVIGTSFHYTIRPNKSLNLW